MFSDLHILQYLLKLAKERDMPAFASQNRPDKVKEIYNAIKREHPTMPCEVAARIASRKGKASVEARKSPQEGGPAYKDKLHYIRSKGRYVRKKKGDE